MIAFAGCLSLVLITWTMARAYYTGRHVTTCAAKYTFDDGALLLYVNSGCVYATKTPVGLLISYHREPRP